VVIGGLPPPGLPPALFLGMREQTHVRRIEPDEEWPFGIMLALDEALGRRDKFVIARFHALFRERSRILDLLLAGAAPAPLLRRVVFVRRPGTDHATRTIILSKIGKILVRRIVGHFRLFFGIEVIEISEKLVKAVIGRQHVIEITEMVLSELSRRIAVIL